MSEDWAAIAAEVSAAIEDMGFQVFVMRQTSPEPVTPWDATPIESSAFPVTAVDLGIRRTRNGGETVEARVLLVAPGDIVPEIGDIVDVRGNRHAVLTVQPTAPGGIDVLYKVELRV